MAKKPPLLPRDLDESSDLPIFIQEWCDAVERQLARVDAERKSTDSYLLVVAAHQVLLFCLQFAEHDPNGEIRRACHDFDAKHPHLGTLRNMLMHADEYYLGNGRDKAARGHRIFVYAINRFEDDWWLMYGHTEAGRCNLSRLTADVIELGATTLAAPGPRESFLDQFTAPQEYRAQAPFHALSALQQQRMDEWLPSAVIERDLSWGLVETKVFLARSADDDRVVVKAGGPDDHDLAREIHAHLEWLGPWNRVRRAPVLLHHDAEAKLIVTRYLPGELVLGTPLADNPEVYRQAGLLLAMLHAQHTVHDTDWEERETARSLHRLDQLHRITSDVAARLRDLLKGFPTPPAALVPTHGDWQPRNWLVHQGTVFAIDFGRAALRPAYTDLTRMAVNEFDRDPGLEAAFLAGYGSDPREAEAWYRVKVREAIRTAVWAYQVGDDEFEKLGHRMIADVLAEADRRA